MSDNLATCPFCGGMAKLAHKNKCNEKGQIEETFTWVECVRCHAQTKATLWSSEAEANWNIRQSDKPLPIEVDIIKSLDRIETIMQGVLSNERN